MDVLRRGLGLVISLAVMVSGTPLVAQADNVLVIVADDLGVDYVGAYQEGSNPPPTPSIDGLAARGVLFRNAWANPSCSPTRACVLTGRYPFRTLVGRWIAHYQNPPNVGLLQGRERTLPEWLDSAGSGYAHAMIGKWHLANAAASADSPRTVGGFSHFAGSLEGQIPSYTNWTRVVDGVAAVTSTYCTTQNTDDALAWIGQQQGPWFCMLTYQAPHIPYHAPPANLHSQNLQGLSPQANHTPTNIPFYRAMVESLDTEMGRLFASLGPAVLNRTNVVFVGDNGTVQRQSVAPFDGRRAKGTPYEGGVNVPLIVAGPAVQQGGREVGALACAVDVFATVLDLAGVAVPPATGSPQHDSVSLLPYLQDPNQAPLRAFAYCEEFTGTTWPAPETNGHAVIRDARYKLIHRYGGGTDELFDLVADPFETANLIGSAAPAVQQARAALLAEIQRLRGTGVVVAFAAYGASACPTSGGVPRLTWQGSTALGSTFAVNVLQVPGSVPAFYLFGESATAWAGVPLPLSLGALGCHPLCELASSVDAIYPTITAAWGGAQQAFTVPNSTALVDAVVFGAWAVADPQAPQNPAGLVTTRSLAITLGR